MSGTHASGPPLHICGETRDVTTNVRIIYRDHNDDILLLVQKHKGLEDVEPISAEAQLVAGAVAAVNENNVNREAFRLPPSEEKVGNFVRFLTLSSGELVLLRSCPAFTVKTFPCFSKFLSL